MSFTLKGDSASCGSGLDGTESAMSWSDTFSSFYSRIKTRTKAQTTCWNNSFANSLLKVETNHLSGEPVTKFDRSHCEFSFFSSPQQESFHCCSMCAVPKQGPWTASLSSQSWWNSCSYVQVCWLGTKIWQETAIVFKYCILWFYIRWCYVILKASFPSVSIQILCLSNIKI